MTATPQTLIRFFAGVAAAAAILFLVWYFSAIVIYILVSAVLAIVGVVNIPIIKYSVEWWNSLHQTATFKITEKPAMPMEMWLPLLLAVLGFYCFFGAVLLYRMRLEVLKREARSSWVKAEVQTLVEGKA